MENLMSLPFSMRDSGSALRSQYCRPVGGGSVGAGLDLEGGAVVVMVFADLDFLLDFCLDF